MWLVFIGIKRTPVSQDTISKYRITKNLSMPTTIYVPSIGHKQHCYIRDSTLIKSLMLTLSR